MTKPKKRNLLVGSFLSIYSYKFPINAVYMLQASEYDSLDYLKWIWRTTDFSSVQYRRKLEYTKKAKAILYLFYGLCLLEILLGLSLIVLGITFSFPGGWPFGLALIVAYPIVIANLIVIPLFMAKYYIVNPKLSPCIELLTSLTIKLAIPLSL